MHWTRICIVAGLLTFAAQAADAAAPPRTMDLEILANGRLLLRGELIDNIDDLEAKLRIMRDREPPFELSIRLPKHISFDSLTSIIKVIESMGQRLGLIGNGGTSKPAPTDPDSSTI